MSRNRRRSRERHGSGRRRRLAVAVAVVVIVVAVLVGQTGRDSRPYHRAVDLGFADLVSPLGSQSASTGRQLAALLATASTDRRSEVFTNLAALSTESRQTAAAAATAVPPSPVGPAGQLCETALSGRQDAMVQLQSAVEGLLGGPDAATVEPPSAVIQAMTTVGEELHSADQRWAQCRRALHHAAGAAHLTASVWITDPASWSTSALSSLVSSLSRSPSLAPTAALAIDGVATAPSALAVTGSQPTYTVAAADDLIVRVLVANTGNVDLHGVVVRVQARPTTALGAGPPVTSTVDLPAGEVIAVSLRGLRVTPGGSYALVVRADAGTGASGQAAAGAVVAAPTDTVAVSLAQAASLASVTVSANPVPVGRQVVYTATVAGSLRGAGNPTGTVAFDDAGTPIPGCGARLLHAGVARCTVTYTTAGYHSITAVYGGTAALAGSTSPAITETVDAVPVAKRSR